MSSIVRKFGLNEADLRGKPLLAIFDRDGTLSPIAENPADAFILREASELLLELSQLQNVTIAIVSARSLRQLTKDFGSAKFILAGNYGLEIAFGANGNYLHPEAQKNNHRLSEIKSRLMVALQSESRVILDDHDLSLCVHWHLTPTHCVAEVHEAISRIRNDFPDLSLRALSTSYEFFPPIEWDKSCALDLIDKTLGRSDWLYLYAGDSEGDEPAFKWINARNGITFRVGSAAESQARFRLRTPEELAELLHELIGLRKHCG